MKNYQEVKWQLKLTKKGSTLTLAEVLGLELNPDAPAAKTIKR